MKNNILGIDTGGTRLKMYTEMNGTYYSKISPSGDEYTKDNFLTDVQTFALNLPEKIEAVGVSYSGMGDEHHIYETGRNYLKGLDASDFDFLGVPAIFINDANAAAVAALTENPDSKVLVSVTNGTGIGSGICINGALFLGANGYAGEITNNPFGRNDDTIVAREVCAGSFIVREFAKVSTDEEKNEIIRKAAENFGLLLVQVIHVLNPDVISLCGGTFQYDGYFETVVETVKRKGTPKLTENLKIELSKLGLYAGCIGAIEYARQIFRM